MPKIPKLKKAPVFSYAPAQHLVFDGDTANTSRYDDVFREHHVGAVSGITPVAAHTYRVEGTGTLVLHITVWSERLIRFRATLGAPDRDFSYALDPAARPTPTETTVLENKTAFTLQTPALQVAVAKADGAIKITDRATGTVLHEHSAGLYLRTTLLEGIQQVRLQFRTSSEEGFFGMGDKAWDTDLQGTEWSNYNEDAFAFTRDRKTNYRSIPFFYGLREGYGYGIFLDNTYRSHFDFNSHNNQVATVWADGGELNYYFLAGPGLDDVAASYHHLTGLPELPPLWALGFHQCRWSYYPESRVRELADTFRAKRIPCDAIYLDIDYMDGYRCFTWNHDYFPDPKGLIHDLREQGFHTVVMIDPGIRVDEDYPVYTDGMAEDVFCKRGSGEMMVGPVWPPECVWPDYTKASVRAWWGQLYRELYCEQGVSGFWNDMNEPAMFKVNRLSFPDDVRHDYDGAPADHRKAHNIYGMQMTRASYEGLKALQPAKRPFLLGRANYSGGQRHAALWTGDNVASWEHLQIANRQCIRLAISGYSMVGTDIGGFVDDPSPELLTRWLQLAVFHPLMRIHSMGNNADGAAEVEAEEVKKAEATKRQDQEPWVHGKEHTRNNRKAIELRYELLPYLYTSFRQHLVTGKPVLRNLFFYDQSDPMCRTYSDQFLFGEDLLVCPVLKKGVKKLEVYLPRGDWYDYWEGTPHPGQQILKIKVKASRIPIFVRAGTSLPTAEVVQSTSELSKASTLHLSVFAATTGSSKFYWDAGEGYGHAAGQYTERTYQLARVGKKTTLAQSIRGDFNASFRTIQVRFLGLEEIPKKIRVDGHKVTSGVSRSKHELVVQVPFDFEEIVLG